MKVSRMSREKLGLLSAGLLIGASASGLVWQSNFLHAQTTPNGLPYTAPAGMPSSLPPDYSQNTQSMPSMNDMPTSAPSTGWNPSMGGAPSMYPAPTSLPSDSMVGDPTQSTPSAAETQLIAPSFNDMMQGMPTPEQLQQMAPDMMQGISSSSYSSIPSFADPSQMMPTSMPSTQDMAVTQQLIQMISALQSQIAQLQTQIAAMQQQAAQASMSSMMSSSSSSDIMHSAASAASVSSSDSGWFDWLKWTW